MLLIMPFHLTFTLLLCFPFWLLAQNKRHSPDELMAIFEKSTTTYELVTLEQPIPTPDYSTRLNDANYYQVDNGGFLAVQESVLSEADQVKRAQAEQFFEAKQYPEARRLYQQLADLYPKQSKWMTYVGQTHHLEGDLVSADAFYQLAIQQNPIDYLAYTLWGELMLDQGKSRAALKAYVKAHLLNRNHPVVFDGLKEALEANGYVYEEWIWTPQIQLQQLAPGKVRLTTHEDWLGYGIAEALWQYDTDFRQKMGLQEGVQALDRHQDALVFWYKTHAKNKTWQQDPRFQTLKRTIKAKQLEAFVFYEMILVDNPFAAYYMEAATLDRLATYFMESRIQPIKGAKKGRRR